MNYLIDIISINLYKRYKDDVHTYIVIDLSFID